jgi:hypothetical protein
VAARDEAAGSTGNGITVERMSNNVDPFELKNLALPREHWAVVPRKIQQQRRHFIKFPCIWEERLAHARCIATYRVALHLLYRHWRAGGRPFSLANELLKTAGVSRWAKWRALRELERLELITIERRSRKSPVISVHA